MNEPNFSTADRVEEHLKALEIRKQYHQTTSTEQTSHQITNDEFTENELATLINPKRMQALMEQADGFLNGMDSMIEEFKNIDES